MLGGHAADRTAFLAALDAALDRDRHSIAVARIDLDRFSRIRENFGSGIARMVRGTLLSRLEELVLQPEHVLRYGEDAFMALVPVADDSPEGLESLGMDIVSAVSAPMDMGNGLHIAVGCNVGIASPARFDDTDSLRLLTGAELAIQYANSLGSRRAIVYEVAPREDPTRLPGLYADMLGAIQRQEFSPVYQPIVGVPDRRILGCEALVRWDHPTHGVIGPGEFVAEAEASGLIRDIDTATRHTAVADCNSWQQYAPLFVSINLSAADLDAPSLPLDVSGSLASVGLPPERVIFEVTETALSQDWSRAHRRLISLKELGARLAVDDFGTGHMYLDRLSTGLFDVLKIDRSLIAPDADASPRRAALLDAVVSMARTLDMDIVAEGVETPEQFERISAAGCTRAQGYLFAQPLRPVDFAGLVAAGTSL
jgi:predicted signal transduction protein with EAL and GGDEF domain